MDEREYLLQLVSDYVRLARSANRSIVIFRSALSLHSKNRLFSPEFRLSLIRSLSFFIRSRSKYLREARSAREKLRLLEMEASDQLELPLCAGSGSISGLRLSKIMKKELSRNCSGALSLLKPLEKGLSADKTQIAADGRRGTIGIAMGQNISVERGRVDYRLLGRAVFI